MQGGTSAMNYLGTYISFDSRLYVARERRLGRLLCRKAARFAAQGSHMFPSSFSNSPALTICTLDKEGE